MTDATPWSRRVGTLAVVGFAAAIVVGASSVPVGLALVAAALLAGGLAVGESDGLGRVTAGSSIAAVGAIGAAGAVVAIALLGGGPWNTLAGIAGAIAVLAGLTLGRADFGDGSLWWTAIVTGVAGLLLVVAGGIWGVVVAPSTEVGGLLVVLLGLHPPQPMVSAFLLLCGLAVATSLTALRALPDVALLGRDAAEEDLAALSDVSYYLGIATVAFVALGIASVVVSAGWSPLREGGIAWTVLGLVTTNSLLRGLLLAVIGLGSVLTVLGVGLRWAWRTDDERLGRWGTAVVAGALGAVPVAGAVAALSLGTTVAGLPSEQSLVAAGVLGLGAAAVLGVLFVLYRFLLGWDAVPFTFAGAALTAVVGVVLATDSIVAPLIAVGATLVAWDVNTYGRGLTGELGETAPASEGELAHAGGSLAVAAAGVGTAIAASFALEWLGPLLATSGATLTVAIGALAIVLGAVLIALDEP